MMPPFVVLPTNRIAHLLKFLYIILSSTTGKFNINEVVSSIMINYTARYVISFFINVLYQSGFQAVPGRLESIRLTLMDTPVGNLKMDIPLESFLQF